MKTSGRGWVGSFSLANATMMVDFREGSQGTSSYVTRIHAMAGTDLNGLYMEKEEAIFATMNYIAKSKMEGDFAGAIHATQDLTTPRHAGEKWRGYWNLEAIPHLFADAFPSWNTLKDAYYSTKSVLIFSPKKTTTNKDPFADYDYSTYSTTHDDDFNLYYGYNGRAQTRSNYYNRDNDPKF